jgi:hypothetical protein
MSEKRPVIQKTLDGEYIKTYLSVAHASVETNIPTTAIFRALNGYQTRTKGYIWEYAQFEAVNKQKKLKSICSECNTDSLKCSWKRNFKPVENWDAVYSKIEGNDSYIVKKCPLFS